MHRYTNKKIKQKNKTILIFSILIITIITLGYILINNLFIKPSGSENITTKLNTESDFLDWFIDFDNLYKKKVKSPKYSLTKESFEKINNFLNNNTESNIYFKDNIYYLDESTTIELDIYTRSLRYTKYNNDTKTEILEINLINGKYYVQLVNSKYIYKISFNKDKVSTKKEVNKKEVIIENSIYSKKDFEW